MDKDLYDEITTLEHTGKEVKSMWVYPDAEEGEEQPHLPEALDKKLQIILLNGVHDKETKRLPT